MKFLRDVHISFKLVKYLRSLKFETIHVNQILDKWLTKDEEICSYADDNDLIVLTKDADFSDILLISNTPKKLKSVILDNLYNSILIKAISHHLPTI